MTIFPIFFIKGIVVNRALPSLDGGSREITLTVPLNQMNNAFNEMYPVHGYFIRLPQENFNAG